MFPLVGADCLSYVPYSRPTGLTVPYGSKEAKFLIVLSRLILSAIVHSEDHFLILASTGWVTSQDSLIRFG